MSQLDDFMSLGLAHAVATDGATFTLRGTTYTGVIGDISTEYEWEGGGDKPVRKLQITMAYTAFSPALRIGETVTARGKAMRLSHTASDATHTVLDLEDITK
jgi:hypothetical protein